MTPRQRSMGGAILLELLVALGLFVMASLTVSVSVSTAMGAFMRSRDDARGAEIARSALARIEAGLATPLTLSGPVPAWRDEVDSAQGDDESVIDVGRIAFDERAPELTGWELAVNAEPSAFPGLSLVEIEATKRDPISGEVLARHTLRQLVRLSAEVADEIGDAEPGLRGFVGDGGRP